MSGGVVSLRKFPRSSSGGRISYPFRLNGGYEFCEPPHGVPLIQSKRGAKTRVSCVRRCADGKFVPAHPINTEGDQWYWVISVWDPDLQRSVNTFYSRVCAWALSLPRGVSARKFCDDYVVHHFFKLRIMWDGSNIWVNNDGDPEDWVLETRAQHALRHLHDP